MASLGQAHIGWVCYFHRRDFPEGLQGRYALLLRNTTYSFLVFGQVAQKGELAELKAWLHVTEWGEGGEEIRNFHFDLRLELSLQNCTFFFSFFF